MVRKQNERTLLLQYRIIQLSLPTNSTLSYFSVSPPFHKIGGFLLPRNIFPKKFPKNFLHQPVLWGELFSTFLVRKIMRAKGSCRSPNGGVSLFVCSPHIKPAFYFILLSCSLSCLQSWQIFKQSGQNRAKMNFSLVVVGVFSGKSETRRGEI